MGPIPKDFSNQNFLVTGAGSGIGKAIAQKIAQAGGTVFLIGRSLQKLTAVQTTLETPGEALACDLTDLGQIKKVIGHLSQKNLKLTGLINNAGIFDRRSFADCSDELWQKHFETNLLGPARLTRECLGLLQSGASVIHISSSLALRSVAGTSVYSAMKAGLISLTKTLALELAAQNIRVNAVCPGLVETPIHGTISDDSRAQMGKAQPLGRIGTPDEIADGVLFLLRSPWTTGSVLTIDGGIQL